MSQISFAVPARALAAAAAKQQQLQLLLQQARETTLAAATPPGGNMQHMRAQLATLQLLQQQQHWLLLYIQLLIATHLGPEALANHRLGPPKQVLQDEEAQTEVSSSLPFSLLLSLLVSFFVSSVSCPISADRIYASVAGFLANQSSLYEGFFGCLYLASLSR